MSKTLARETNVLTGARRRGRRTLTGRQRGARSPEPQPFTIGRHPALPAYLRDVYTWAYLNPRNARLLDKEAVVNTLLWGNSGRLRRALLAEITAGDRVLQAAHVYGRLIPEIAKAVGPTGCLDVVDIAPLQVALCRRKLRAFPHARARIADAVRPGDEKYDVVVSFFLLHELPNTYKCAVVDSLLARLSPGGKVVFIDYHAPAHWHLLRGFMRQIFAHLEPFAEAMWRHEIEEFASDPEPYVWRTQTCFGGLYQKTVARRRTLKPHTSSPQI
ncbi:MAG: rhodoquinone biosynthesis methyltransferase RquA [Alphaproteobacteria bacterium]